MWNFAASKPNLDIQYNTPENSDKESGTIPLARQRQDKRKQISPIKITPDKLSITFGDKTSVLINRRKQVARKTLMRRAPEPRGTIKPLWNIIPDGTITDYTPTTISIDTHNRANSRIRKSDLAMATETYQKPTPPPQIQEPKPRLMHFVACKTVRDYNRNREKIRKFCLEEKKQLHREAQLTGTQYEREQDRPNELIPESSNIPARTFEEGPNEDRPGKSYMASNLLRLLKNLSGTDISQPSSRVLRRPGSSLGSID